MRSDERGDRAAQLLDIASNLLMTYGYWAVLLFVAVESVGIPVPGETMLLSVAVYAGLTHQLNIALVIVAAATGAIVGDNVGYLLGREGGYRLLRRYGRYVPSERAAAAVGRISLPAAWRQGRLLRPLRRGVADVGSLPGRHAPDAVIAISCRPDGGR